MYLWHSLQQGFGSLINKSVLVKVTHHLHVANCKDPFSVPTCFELSVASDMVDPFCPLAARTLHSNAVAPCISLAFPRLPDLHMLGCLLRGPALSLFFSLSILTLLVISHSVSLLYKLYADDVQTWIFRPERTLLSPTSKHGLSIWKSNGHLKLQYPNLGSYYPFPTQTDSS